MSYGRFLHGHFLRYSRDQELQADACGIRMLSGISEIDARKASGASLKELKEDQKGNGGFQGHVSTHPGYPERKQRIELLLVHYSRKPPR